MNEDRDFRGYGDGVPGARWPNRARLALSLVVNVEEGAELSVGAGDETNEFIYENVERVEGARDLCMESHFEYGPRVGWHRIRSVLKAYRAPATISASGRALAVSPWLGAEAVEDNHEIAGHGWRWESHAHMGEATERQAILRTVQAITAASGRPPVGWHTRSAASPNTRRLLVEHGGFLYDSDAYNDDTPYVVHVGEHPHVVLPYSFDTNDMRYYNRGGFVFADDFARYCIDSFERLYEEGATAPRMMSIGLHLRISGRPGRIGGLERVLAHVTNRADVWIARREAIAHAWRSLVGLPAWQPREPRNDFAP